MIRRFSSIVALTLLAAVMGCHRHAAANVAPAWSDGATIEAVQIQGNHQVAIASIAALMQTKAGGKIDSEIIKDDIGRLRSLGFDDIKVKEEKGEKGGKVLTFEMKERLGKVKG